MKKKYLSPQIEIEALEPEAICSACFRKLSNNSDLNNCGYAMEMPGIGVVYLFPQEFGGCTCWSQGVTDMYCYMPSESVLFSS